MKRIVIFLCISFGLWHSLSAQSIYIIAEHNETTNAVYDVDAQAFFDINTELTTVQKDAINDFVTTLKANGTWSKYHVIYPFVGGTEIAHSFNLKNTAQFTLTFYGNLTHDGNGVQGNGVDGYADTGFNPSTGFASKDDSTFIAYVNDNDDVAIDPYPSMMGAYTDGTLAYLMDLKVEGATKYVGFRNTGTWSDYTNPTTVRGLWTMTRNNSLDTELYQNTTLHRTVTQSAGTGLPDKNIYLWNNNFYTDSPHPQLYSVRRLAFVAFADGMSSSEIANDYIAIEALQDALGRGVN